jgi:integrase
MIARYKPKGRRAANRKHFTEENVLKLPRKNHQFLIWDEGTGAARGLAILVSPTGTKSYRVVFYFPGSSKPNWKHLGRVGEITLEAARKAALEARGAATQGDDPRAGDANKSDNFKAAIEDYTQHEQIGRHHNKSALETQKVMFFNCGPWLKRPVATIRYAEIDALLELIRDGNDELKARPYLANRLHSHLKAFFGWCVRKKKISTSPMADMQKPWNGATRRTREWFKGKPADKAVTALWGAADKIGGNEGRYLKLLLLTGKRKSALASMRWEQIEDNWFWDAPPSGSKNKRLHPIPLPKKAQEILHPRKDKGLVFEGLHQRQGLEKLQFRIRAASGLDDFFYHGVRHLLESKLAEIKIPPHIRDVLFDHAPNRGTGAVYDHYEYRDEMLAALNLWAEHIDKLRAPAKGVAILR